MSCSNILCLTTHSMPPVASPMFHKVLPRPSCFSIPFPSDWRKLFLTVLLTCVELSAMFGLWNVLILDTVWQWQAGRPQNNTSMLRSDNLELAGSHMKKLHWSMKLLANASPLLWLAYVPRVTVELPWILPSVLPQPSRWQGKCDLI